MNIPGMEKKGGQSTADIETGSINEDNEKEELQGPVKITPLQKVSKIKNIQEILKMLNVKSIKKIKSVKAIQNIEEIKKSIATEFIKNHGLKSLIADDKKEPETYDDPELKKIVKEIKTEEIIQDTIDRGISKEKSKLETLEQVKIIHAEKKKEKIYEYENLKEIIENHLNGEAGTENDNIKKMTGIKSIAPVKSIEEVKSMTPIKSLEEVKSMIPVKSLKEIKNIYTLTNDQADLLKALTANKQPVDTGYNTEKTNKQPRLAAKFW